MAQTRDWMLGGCLVVAMLGGGALMCTGMVGLGMVRAMAGSPQHEVSPVLQEDCSVAFLWDDAPEGHLTDLTSEAIVEATLRAEPAARDSAWMLGPIVHAALDGRIAACQYPEGFVVAYNPKRFAGVWQSLADGDTAHAAVELDGHPFWRMPDGTTYGRIDGTLILGPTRARTEAAVIAVGRQPEPSDFTADLAASLGDGGASIGLVTEGNRLIARAWAPSRGEVRGTGTVWVGPENEPDLEALAGLCEQLRALPEVSAECSTSSHDRELAIEGVLRGRAGIVKALSSVSDTDGAHEGRPRDPAPAHGG